VVAAAGHPTPGPRKFCKVTSEACMRAILDAFESSVGKETETPGLLTARPAATFALREAMNSSRGGGQAQGILTTTPAALVIPSQSPVPVGFKPDGWPNSGTRAGSTPPAAGGAGAGAAGSGAGAGAAGGGGGGALSGPAWIAACWARNVVAAAGHPTPGPRRFCRVIRAVCIRANWDALEPSVGKDTEIPGLLTARPAFTLALRDCKKSARLGGQAHGILTTTPAALRIPSQSPVPVGFKP